MTTKGHPVILFVGNDEPDIDSVSVLMAAESVQLDIARSGFDALEVLQDGLRPDLLICDSQASDLSGLDVVKWARAEIGADTPALIFAGEQRLDLAEHEVLRNCRLLRKPAQSEQFLAAICDSLEITRLDVTPQRRQLGGG